MYRKNIAHNVRDVFLERFSDKEDWLKKSPGNTRECNPGEIVMT